MTRLTVVLPALVVAVLIASGCGGSEPAPTPSVVPASVTTTTAADLRDIVNLRGPAEITYRWTGLVRGGGPGRVISRLNGEFQRWDTLTEDSDYPTKGYFTVYRSVGGTDQAFGCHWFVAAGDRSRLDASCTNHDEATVMDVFLRIALFLAPGPGHQLAPRTILGHAASCYGFPTLKEVCVDQQGYVLYLSNDSTAGSDTFEAISFFPLLQPFAWPPHTDVERTPTRLNGDHGLHHDPVSALSLDMPTEFHLSSPP